MKLSLYLFVTNMKYLFRVKQKEMSATTSIFSTQA